MPSVQNVQSEGKDVQLFRVRMRGIFEKVTAGISTERFEEIHGAVLQRSQRLARHLHKIWQAAALDGMVKELDEIIIDEHLDEKLKQRARIIEECQEDKSAVAWRPPGKPTEHIRSFDMKEKIKRKKQLEVFVKSKEAELEQLRREVSDGRMRIQELDSVLDTQINKLLSVYMREKQCQAELQNCLDQLSKEVQ